MYENRNFMIFSTSETGSIDFSEVLETSVGALKASYHHAVKKIEYILKES